MNDPNWGLIVVVLAAVAFWVLAVFLFAWAT